jgi:ATP-dependent exoDNAse (exonuclease V) beta subunit
MEFLLQLGRHWAHGFMDLVFRLPSAEGGKHPWRYYVLDWKSDTLPDFTNSTIADCVETRHYNLQARLYCHALDVHLRGILGEVYDPAHHLGGAVYLFVREHERGPIENASVWKHAAQPESDRGYILDKVQT